MPVLAANSVADCAHSINAARLPAVLHVCVRAGHDPMIIVALAVRSTIFEQRHGGRQAMAEIGRTADSGTPIDPAQPPEPPPDWWRPVYLGRPAASEAMATVAAPLLAAFSVTVIGVIAQDVDEFPAS